MSGTDTERLTAVLGSYPADLLAGLAQQAGLGGGPLRAERLLDGARAEDALAAVEEVEGEFVAFVARLGGEVGPGAADWWLRHRGVADPNAAVERLAGAGLLFYLPVGGPAHGPTELGEGARGLHLAGKLWVPEPIGRHAAEQHPVPPLAAMPEPQQPVRADIWEVVRRLFLLLRGGAAKPSPSGGIARPTRRGVSSARGRRAAGARGHNLAALLGESRSRREDGAADGHAAWLDALALELDLTGAFFEQTPPDQRRTLLEAAVAQTAWGELDAAPGVVLEPSSSPTPGRSDIPSPGSWVRARRRLLRLLPTVATPGAWHSAVELAERAMEASPDFLIRRRQVTAVAQVGAQDQEPPGWTYRGIRRIAPDGLEPLGLVRDWASVEGAFVAAFVRGPLHWLGLVDVAGPPEDLRFRLTTAGWAGVRERGEPEGARQPALPGEADETPAARFFVQPNFEIMADGGGDNVAAIVRLSRVADLESFDRAALLRVTRQSVVRGLDAGLTRDEIVAILGDGGRIAIPQNVEYSVTEWAAAHDRFELRTEACVVEVDDPADLDALEEQVPGCLQRLGPTAACVLTGAAGRVEAALRDRTDVLHIDHAEGLSGVFHLDERMVATPRPEHWYWYPQHLLEQIAEREEARGPRPGGVGTAASGGSPSAPAELPRFRLTRESVRAGLERGLRPEAAERLIECCADAELTARQRLLLRGWLGRYESAHLASATVLALPTEAVSDALAIPELHEQIAGWLSPRVFVVRPGGRAKVRRLLDQAGIEVGEEITTTALGDGPGSCPPRQGGRLDEGEPRSAVWGRRRWRLGDAEDGRLALVEEAIGRGLALEIEYASVVKGEPPRCWQISPHRLERSRWGQLRVHAYCHARKTERVFDLSRLMEIRVVGVGQAGPERGG